MLTIAGGIILAMLLFPVVVIALAGAIGALAWVCAILVSPISLMLWLIDKGLRACGFDPQWSGPISNIWKRKDKKSS
jgi:hypothetical protein